MKQRRPAYPRAHGHPVASGHRPEPPPPPPVRLPGDAWRPAWPGPTGRRDLRPAADL